MLARRTLPFPMMTYRLDRGGADAAFPGFLLWGGRKRDGEGRGRRRKKQIEKGGRWRESSVYVGVPREKGRKCRHDTDKNGARFRSAVPHNNSSSGHTCTGGTRN